MEIKLKQALQPIDYWWNGRPQRITLEMLKDEEVDVLYHRAVAYRAGGKQIPGRIVGAGRHRHYKTLFYIMETDDGKIIHSAKLSIVGPPPEPVPIFEMDPDFG